MRNVVFVAPFFLEATLRFIDATSWLPGVQLSLVSQDPEEKLPPGLRGRLSAHYRVENGLDPQQLTAAVRAISATVGTIDRLMGALEELQVPLAHVRAGLGIPGMGVEAALNFRDKARMKDALRAANLPCARHQLAHSAGDVRAFVQASGLPMVVKPPAGAGARNTFRLDDEAAVEQWLAADPPREGQPALLEEFIVGREYSFDSVLVRGRPVWHSISCYEPTPLEVLRNPWIQWCVLLPRDISGPEYDPIRDAAFRGLRTLGLETGLTHMEWFRRADGSIAISEVAARPPGAQFMTLLSYAHDADFYRLWANLMVFDEFAPPPRQYACGAAFIRGQGAGRVKAIHGLEEAQEEIGPLLVESRMRRAGQSPSSSYEGDGYVVLRHTDTDVVARALQRVVSLVRVELG